MAGIVPGTMGQPVFLEKTIYQRPESAALEPKAEVATLIQALSDASAEKRRRAARALLEMGSAIEPQLVWAQQHGENGGRPLSWALRHVPESNKWVQDPRNLRPWHAEHELDVLISHLQEQRRSAGSIITLHHTNEWLTNVLCDLGKQSDADVSVGNFYFSLDWVNTNRVTVNVERASFWQALKAVQRATGLASVHLNGQNRLVLQPGAPDANISLTGSVVSGPLQIVPLSLERVKPPYGDDGRRAHGVILTLVGLAEPGLSATGPHAAVQNVECVDVQGQSLFADHTRQFWSVENHDTWRWTVPVDLGAVQPGQRIVSLKGEFSVGLGLTDRYITITNLLHAEGRGRELDGLQVVVVDVSRAETQYRVDVELSAPAGSPYTRSFSASSELEVWLWDDSTQTIIARKEFKGVREEGERTVGSWTLTTPGRSSPPATLVWKTPTETRWHTVPFELRDLAVP